MSACVVEPLERLADEVRAFVLRPELRSLHVAADAHLSSGALRVVLAGEHLADNLAPWLAVEADTHQGDAWEQIEARLVAEHQTRREAGAPLEPLPPDVPGALGPARCAARMRQCSASVKEPARGLVVVLLCKGATVSEAWLLRLTEMLGDPALGNVRIVVFTAMCPAALEWSARLPPTLCITHRCELDPHAVTAELEAEVKAEDQGGGTWPADVEPPPRPGAAAPPPREPSPAEELGRCIKRALLALRRGDGPETARQQSRARDLCYDAGRLEDAVRMELVLGGYLVQLREPERAQESFARAAQAAEKIDAHALHAQACYAEAFVWRERRRPEDGLRCYWAGIEAAKRGPHVRLVFDGYWEAGMLLRPLERTSALVSLWSDAIRTAGGYRADQLRKTRIEAITRELAAELRALRRPADAKALEEWLAEALTTAREPKTGSAKPAASASGGGHAPSAS